MTVGTESLGPIWILWLQGFRSAPEVARASLESWRRRNPDLTIHELDATSWRSHVPQEDADRIARAPDPVVLSELLRLELLHRHGGVWVDATTVCARPLANWLPGRVEAGLVAFARPGPDRPLSTWFLAARPGEPTVAAWRQRALHHWRGRSERDEYFWMHRTFGHLLEEDPDVAARWAASVPLSSAPSDHPFHFAPGDARLAAPPTPDDLAALAGGSHPPVFKLTYKGIADCSAGSLLDVLLRLARGGLLTGEPMAAGVPLVD